MRSTLRVGVNMTQDFELKTVETSTGRVAYREAGEGPVLVCLHGLGGGALSWQNQFAGLSDTRRVISWDCPGYGGSADHASGAPSPADFADALIEMLAGAGVTGEFDLVGHSMGGVVAPQVVARHPGRVRRLVLSATRVGFRDWGSYEQRLKQRDEMTSEEFGRTRAENMCGVSASAASKAAVAAIASEIRPSGYRGAVHVLSVSDNTAEVAALTIPVLVVAGAEDRVAPEEATLALAAAIPGARRVVIQDAGHAAYIEQAAVYNDLLREFLG
jgi:3-oxoadipate enol-lactonase